MTWLSEIEKQNKKDRAYFVKRFGPDEPETESERKVRVIRELVEWGFELEGQLRKHGHSELLLKIARDNNLSPDAKKVVMEVNDE